MSVKVTFRQGSTQTKAKPNRPCEDCEESDDRYEVSRDKIGYSFDRGATGLTLANNFNNLVEPERRNG